VCPPRGGIPKNNIWKIETHNVVLRPITCLLDFLKAISNYDKVFATKLGPTVTQLPFTGILVILSFFKTKYLK